MTRRQPDYSIQALKPLSEQVKDFKHGLTKKNEVASSLLAKICENIVTRYALKEQIAAEHFSRDLHCFTRELEVYIGDVADFFQKYQFSLEGGALMVDVFSSIKKVVEFIAEEYTRTRTARKSTPIFQSVTSLCSQCNSLKENANIKALREQISEDLQRKMYLLGLNETQENQNQHQQLYEPNYLTQILMESKMEKLQMGIDQKKTNISTCIQDIKKCLEQLCCCKNVVEMNRGTPNEYNFSRHIFDLGKHFYSSLMRIDNRIKLLKKSIKVTVEYEMQTEPHQIKQSSNGFKLKAENEKLKKMLGQMKIQIEEVKKKSALFQQQKDKLLHSAIKQSVSNAESVQTEANAKVEVFKTIVVTQQRKIKVLEEEIHQLKEDLQICQAELITQKAENMENIQATLEEAEHGDFEKIDFPTLPVENQQVLKEPRMSFKNKKITNKLKHFLSQAKGSQSQNILQLFSRSKKENSTQTQKNDIKCNIKRDIKRESKRIQQNQCSQVEVQTEVFNQRRSKPSLNSQQIIKYQEIGNKKSISCFPESKTRQVAEMSKTKLILHQKDDKADEELQTAEIAESLPHLTEKTNESFFKQQHDRINMHTSQKSDISLSTKINFGRQSIDSFHGKKRTKQEQMMATTQFPYRKAHLMKKSKMALCQSPLKKCLHEGFNLTEKDQRDLFSPPKQSMHPYQTSGHSPFGTPLQNYTSMRESVNPFRKEQNMNILNAEEISFTTKYYSIMASLHLHSINNYNLVRNFLQSREVSNQFSAGIENQAGTMTDCFNAIVLLHRRCGAERICPHLQTFYEKVKCLL